jgi:hypothetical protein
MRGHFRLPAALLATGIVPATILSVTPAAAADDSAATCTWVVRPHLDDQEHGTKVLLTPQRYVLRLGSASVTATPREDGWTLSATERATFRLTYEVLWRLTGDVVLRREVTLTCGPDGAVTAPAAAPPPTPPEGSAGPLPRQWQTHRAEPEWVRALRPPERRATPAPDAAEAAHRRRQTAIFRAILWSFGHALVHVPQVIVLSISAVAPDPGTRRDLRTAGLVLLAPVVGTAIPLFYEISQMVKYSPVRVGVTAGPAQVGLALSGGF